MRTWQLEGQRSSSKVTMATYRLPQRQ